MKHLDLFSGIGGFALACQWAGIETIGFVEIDKYCQKVLKKHWPNVPIVEDIRDVKKIKEIVANGTKPRLERGTGQSLQRGSSRFTRSSNGSREQRESNSESPTILITGGFPCQPFSVAGKRQGTADNRYLWGETLAVIEAIKPKWVLLENVTGIINLALDTVLSDLESAGYSYETLIIPACAVNAPHRRDRVWVVAYSKSNRIQRSKCTKPKGTSRNVFDGSSQDVAHSKGSGWGTRASKRKSRRCSEDMADSHCQPGYAGKDEKCGERREQSTQSTTTEGGWWAVEPQLGRVAHGIPNRVDRLKCLGNAIVPQVASEIIKAITNLEKVLNG